MQTKMSTVAQLPKPFSRLLDDTSLTKKAYLNALTVMLEYVSQLVVGFILTPLMVAGLGNYFYGMWQILNRLVGYISPASGRPGFALKATLANQQHSMDFDRKRRYVGSTLVIWVLFVPLLAGLGGIVCWLVPVWVHARPNYVWIIRAATALLVTNMIVDTLASVPQGTLQGENLGYKRMGVSVALIFVGSGFFVWLALHLKTGITGVAVAVVAKTVLTGLFYLAIVRKYAPWFGAAKPRGADVREMLGLSWWFMGSNLVTSALLASDVVVLGFLGAVESVTGYTLTKNAPETLIEVIVIVVYGITPGLGGIIGSGDHERAISVRGEMLRFVWLFATSFGATLVLWNRTFVSLWVGASHYAGSAANVLVVLASIQLTLIRADSNLLDLTLRLRAKVLLGLLSVIVSVGAAGVAVGYLHSGVVGLCLGIIAGRAIISVGYPVLVGRYLGLPFSSQIKSLVRPGVVSILLCAAAAEASAHLAASAWAAKIGWFVFLPSAACTGGLILLLAFYLGLTKAQRGHLLNRIRAGLFIPGIPGLQKLQ